MTTQNDSVPCMGRKAGGKWEVQDLGPARGDLFPHWKEYCIRDTATNVHLATVGDVDRYFEGDNGRIAHLMAAAPQLLAACVAFADTFDSKKHHPANWPELAASALEQCRAAIAKAQVAK